jgi:phosphomannomutase
MMVHVGRDTRSHSPGLAKLVVHAAIAMGATVIDLD